MLIKKTNIKIMLVDDSKVILTLLERILSTHKEIDVVAKASNGQEAIDRLKDNQNIEMILLDLQMPVLDGLSAIPILLKMNPGLKIIIVSSLAIRGAEETVQALALGAIDFIEKPCSQNGMTKFSDELIEKIRNIFPDLNQNHSILEGDNFTLKKGRFNKPEILVIASSTGGPRALMEIFGGLSQSFLDKNIIIVTQHIKNEFIEILIENINSIDKIHCKKVEDKEILMPGMVYFAHGDRNLEIIRFGARLRAILSDTPPENFCRPSADPMFRSLARNDINVLALVLTGIGKDGLSGAKELANKNNEVIAQDKETSVVWGMPGEVANAGICSSILPLDEIANYIEKRMN